jgi:hypothetical protein
MTNIGSANENVIWPIAPRDTVAGGWGAGFVDAAGDGVAQVAGEGRL